jgi:hypothetical protein
VIFALFRSIITSASCFTTRNGHSFPPLAMLFAAQFPLPNFQKKSYTLQLGLTGSSLEREYVWPPKLARPLRGFMFVLGLCFFFNCNAKIYLYAVLKMISVEMEV